MDLKEDEHYYDDKNNEVDQIHQPGRDCTLFPFDVFDSTEISAENYMAC